MEDGEAMKRIQDSMMGLPVELFCLYANRSGSSESGREEVMKVLTNHAEDIQFIWERCRHYLSTVGFVFVVCDGFKSSPHVSGVGAPVVRVHFVPVLFLCTANSSPECVP